MQKQTALPKHQPEYSAESQDHAQISPKEADIPSQHKSLLEKYHDLKKIGHGAQATMLKGFDKTGHPVAIKVFDYQAVSGLKEIELFDRETEVLKDLDIEGIPKYIETIKSNDKTYLVEQYIDAPSLEKELKRGRIFSTEECITLIKNTATILKELGQHEPPIVHRDIKPANMLVDEQLRVYLVDFGVVANTLMTFSTTFAGTAGYVAPEQLYGKATPASDIFSLGATMLHLISHVAPCDMQLKGSQPDFNRYLPRSVPDWLSTLIKQMMSADPGKRPQNGDQLLKQIDAAQNAHATTNSRYIKIAAATVISLMIILIAYSMLSQPSKGKVSPSTITGRIVTDHLETSSPSPISEMKTGFDIISTDTENDKGIDPELYHKASNGDVQAQFDLGSKYYYGFGDVIQDRQKALQWFLKAASQGHREAQAKLGTMYKLGYGTQRNRQEAIKWYLLAAEQGDADAANNLGNLYQYHIDNITNQAEAVKNYQEAVKWYTKAAEQGNAKAMNALGEIYENGEEGIEQNHKEAFKWYTKAAELGEPDAQFALGHMYDLGLGTRQNYKLAWKWYWEAAIQDHAQAKVSLGTMYALGHNVKQDYQQAIQWYQRAASQDEETAFYQLGRMYEMGNGVKQNKQEAFNYYLKAADKGDGLSQYQIARMYDNGEGTEQNKSKAVEWYQKAAIKGIPDAQYVLGLLYLKGEGITQSNHMASWYFERAANQGHEGARKMLRQIK